LRENPTIEEVTKRVIAFSHEKHAEFWGHRRKVIRYYKILNEEKMTVLLNCVDRSDLEYVAIEMGVIQALDRDYFVDVIIA